MYDDFTRERFGSTSGTVLKPGLSAPNILSAPTLEELATQIDTRLAEVAAKTGNFRLDPDFADNMKETIVRFNQFAETGKDRDFRRGEAPMENTAPRPSGNDKPNKTMYPISLTGPYYAVHDRAGNPRYEWWPENQREVTGGRCEATADPGSLRRRELHRFAGRADLLGTRWDHRPGDYLRRYRRQECGHRAGQGSCVGSSGPLLMTMTIAMTVVVALAGTICALILFWPKGRTGRR